MIPVTLAQEPASFDAKVRQPGLSAIDEMLGKPPRLKRPGHKRQPLKDQNGQNIQQAEHIPASAFPPYWREALPDMMQAYERRCAYLAMYLHHATSSPSVDHVLPKSYAWDQVYEWANYRLCAQLINANKGALLELADPCMIGQGWFALNLNTLLVEPGPQAPAEEISRITATLPILNHRLCVQERMEYLRCYQLGPHNGGIDLAYLESRAPFIAQELRRQGRLGRNDAGIHDDYRDKQQ